MPRVEILGMCSDCRKKISSDAGKFSEDKGQEGTKPAVEAADFHGLGSQQSW